MKYNIDLTNNKIVSNLEYQLNENELYFKLNEDCHIEISINGFTKQIKFELSDNIKVNSTMTLSAGKSRINYLLNKNSYLNEFVVVEHDKQQIELIKHVKQNDDSEYEVSNGFFSDSSIKCNVEVDLNGINAKALHNIAVIARQSDVKEFNIRINNNEKMTSGELNNFGVVKDKASLIFNGIGYIKNGATQAKAHQESKIITFDPHVKAQANPFLIIDEADVEASHAAAVGKLDEEQIYYLQSRGITLEDASRLITYGYLKPVLNKISDAVLKEKLEKLIEKKVGI